MAITSYFYDSVAGDRPYSAKDFAKAFDIAFETGILIRETVGGTLGFDIGGTNFTTIYEGKAIIEGHFVEVTGTEIIVVPAGTYAGQVVIQVDMDTERTAKIIVKTDQTPIQSTSLYELPLYNCTVANGIITAVTDLRFQGGAVPNNHLHRVSDITENVPTYFFRDNGVYLQIGEYSIALTPAQPPHSAKRVWIQVDN